MTQNVLLAHCVHLKHINIWYFFGFSDELEIIKSIPQYRSNTKSYLNPFSDSSIAFKLSFNLIGPFNI